MRLYLITLVKDPEFWEGMSDGMFWAGITFVPVALSMILLTGNNY
jgi:hypothetical protein